MAPLKVTVRSYSGAYIAKCGKAQASSTNSEIFAAEAAAGKALGVLPRNVRLCTVPESEMVFFALPASEPDLPPVYKTAGQLQDAKLARMYPGTLGDRLD